MDLQPMSRDEGIVLLERAARVLRQMNCGIQASDVAWTARQLDDGRAPVWMLRQAREYRRAKILRFRETGGGIIRNNPHSFNVRATLFVAAVLRAVAANEERKTAIFVAWAERVATAEPA